MEPQHLGAVERHPGVLPPALPARRFDSGRKQPPASPNRKKKYVPLLKHHHSRGFHPHLRSCPRRVAMIDCWS
jgi:hypothetical protein